MIIYNVGLHVCDQGAKTTCDHDVKRLAESTAVKYSLSECH